MSPTFYALRGATRVARNDATEIRAAGAALLRGLVEANGLSPADLVSAVFTSTPDLTAAFPATGAREAGFGAVPMLGAIEVGVPGAMDRVVRVLVHVHARRPRGGPRHVYLGDAAALRPDLDPAGRPAQSARAAGGATRSRASRRRRSSAS